MNVTALSKVSIPYKEAEPKLHTIKGLFNIWPKKVYTCICTYLKCMFQQLAITFLAKTTSLSKPPAFSCLLKEVGRKNIQIPFDISNISDKMHWYKHENKWTNTKFDRVKTASMIKKTKTKTETKVIHLGQETIYQKKKGKTIYHNA